MSNEMFQYNSTLANINVDNAVASILSKFEPDFIIHVVEDSLNMKFRPWLPAMPNMVYSCEQTFKLSLDNFTSYSDTIEQTRNDTYTQIINIICRYYNLEFNEIDQRDVYSAAYYLYDFLISNFTKNMIYFFTNYIVKEKNFIYDAFNLGETRRNKDASTLYSKRMFKNAKLGAIHANIDLVLDNMVSFDITLYNILDMSYKDEKNIVRYVDSLVSDLGDFYKTYYVPYITDQITRPDLITGIKSGLQQFADLDPTQLQ